MSAFDPNFYAQWREKNASLVVLHENDVPPERLLQAIWHHQRLLRDRLQTLDGKSIQILHPGFWNREAGPDFRNAVLNINGQIKTGDVELDLNPSGWHAHGHDHNPNYKNVVLHVIWDSETGVPASGEKTRKTLAENVKLPLLAAKKFLDAPLSELTTWLGSEAAQGWPAELRGQCCAPLRDLPEQKLSELFRQAAFVRLQRKAHELESRARQAGWEQALWEGLFRALGYKQNIWPMRRVAELLPVLKNEKASLIVWQSRLLGVSGLLPNEFQGRDSSYQRQLWDIWWRERERFHEFIFPDSLWKFNGLRPANRPERRLALAAQWLASEHFLPNLENWFTNGRPTRQAQTELYILLKSKPDDFWSSRWTFRSAALPKPQPLIGEQRVTDLAMNVVLPWFWKRAVVGRNRMLQKRAEELYFTWPAAEDNVVLKLARQRLLATRKNRLFQVAANQQGLLQVVKDFCERSNALCASCQFPDLVKQWNAS